MAVPPDTTRPTLGRSELDVFGGTRGSVAKGELSDAKFDGVRTHGARGTAFALGVRTVDLMDGVGEGDNGAEEDGILGIGAERGCVVDEDTAGVGKKPDDPRHPTGVVSSVGTAALGGCEGIGCAGMGE